MILIRGRLVIICIVAVVLLIQLTLAAPTKSNSNIDDNNINQYQRQSTQANKNNNNNNNNQRSRFALFNLFRRGSSQDEKTAAEKEEEENMSGPEKEAMKFLESIPNVSGNSNKEPTTFRERLGDTFGLLREGVGNQFRSWRENFSETVDDIRDTWSSNDS